jgi:hypothetical protein
MASGIIVPNLLSIFYSTTTPLLIAQESGPTQRAIQQYELGKPTGQGTLGPWTPPQWSKPALTVISLPQTAAQVAQAQQAIATAGNDNVLANQIAPGLNNYVFDAVIRASHRRVLKKTQHPVMTGTNISDHAYIEPARLTLEIGMSDAMAAFASGGEWATGWNSKSISAWQTIKQWLRATIVFGELITASVLATQGAAATSARPHVSNISPAGVVQGAPIAQDQLLQHVVTSDAYPVNPAYPDVKPNPFVPGAGTVSSPTLH